MVYGTTSRVFDQVERENLFLGNVRWGGSYRGGWDAGDHLQPAFLSLTRAEKTLNTKMNDNSPSLVTKPDYRSPLNRDLWIDHLYF